LDGGNCTHLGYSVIALWADAEPLLETRRRAGLRLAFLWERFFISYTLGSLLGILTIPLFVWFVLTNYEPGRARSEALGVAGGLLAFFLLGAIAGLAQTHWRRREAFGLQSAAVQYHSEEILFTYGLLRESPQERSESLRSLSLQILSGRAGPPGATMTAGGEELRLSRIVDRSIERSKLPAPVTNVAGDVHIRTKTLTATMRQISITVSTGVGTKHSSTPQGSPAPTGESTPTPPTPWEQPQRHHFEVTGGADAKEVEIRMVVDAPGLRVEPRTISAKMSTVNDSRTWPVDFAGEGASNTDAWITLYVGTRFVRAFHLEGM
jgi:hypothetical protein